MQAAATAPLGAKTYLIVIQVFQCPQYGLAWKPHTYRNLRTLLRRRRNIFVRALASSRFLLIAQPASRSRKLGHLLRNGWRHRLPWLQSWLLRAAAASRAIRPGASERWPVRAIAAFQRIRYIYLRGFTASARRLGEPGLEDYRERSTLKGHRWKSLNTIADVKVDVQCVEYPRCAAEWTSLKFNAFSW